MAKRKPKATVLSFPSTAPVSQIGARANCDRCKRELQVAPRRSEDSKPFRLAVIPKGVCPDCVMTQFLYNTYPINMQLDERGPGVLLHPQMREAILMCGLLDNCDMKVDEINWQRVVDNWGLPVENKPSAKNPYQMGDAARAKQSLVEFEDAVAAGDDIITELMLRAGVPRANIENAIHSDTATRVIGHGGSYSLEDVRKRRAARPFGDYEQTLAPEDIWPDEQTPIDLPGKLTFCALNADGSVTEIEAPPYIPPPPECPFCEYRGCLHCETEARKARKAQAQRTFEDLETQDSKPN